METMNLRAAELGVAGSTLPGQSESGDRRVVCSFQNRILVAGLDGLGHGREAAAAATKAVHVLEDSASEPTMVLVQRCHQELKATRGVVMSIASLSISYGLITWMGVGNVQGVLWRSRKSQEQLLLRAGVVGVQLPPLQAVVLQLVPGTP